MKQSCNFITMLKVIILLIVLTSSLQYTQVKGGRWAFENNSNDDATWDDIENNGSLSGAASYQNIAPLKQGSYYLSLEDSADYGAVIVAPHSELNFKNKNFAASLLVYPITGYGNPQYLFMKGDRSGSVKLNNYALRIHTNHLEFIIHEESGVNKLARSSFQVPKNEWTFLAVSLNADQSKLYMWNEPESAPIDTFDFNVSLFPNENNLYIGTAGENGFRRFWGRIDDVRISNNESDILDISTNVELKNSNSLPYSFSLNQNYPNPFNPETTLRFTLAENGFTKLDIYNIIGEHIESLVNGSLVSGEHSIHFNASNLPSGIYFYQLEQGNHFDMKKMLLLK